MNQLHNLTTTMSGEYKFEIRKPDGTITETEWIPNLILNGGMDRIGTNNALFNCCRVGAGNSVPTFTQNSLDSQIASSATSTSGNFVNEGAPLYRTLATYTYAFAQGGVVGNISEVGVGWTATGATLFSRALILDSNGSPTTITVVADDQLVVYYRIQMVPPITDGTGSIVLGGNTYNYTIRLAYAASFATHGALFSSGEFISSLSDVNWYPGGSTLGPITGFPSGTGSTQSTIVVQPYVAGSYYRDAVVSYSISQGNHANGIQAFLLYYGTSVTKTIRFQIHFDTPIPKTNTTILSLSFRYSWARG